MSYADQEKPQNYFMPSWCSKHLQWLLINSEYNPNSLPVFECSVWFDTLWVLWTEFPLQCTHMLQAKHTETFNVLSMLQAYFQLRTFVAVPPFAWNMMPHIDPRLISFLQISPACMTTATFAVTPCSDLSVLCSFVAIIIEEHVTHLCFSNYHHCHSRRCKIPDGESVQKPASCPRRLAQSQGQKWLCFSISCAFPFKIPTSFFPTPPLYTAYFTSFEF